LIGNAGKAVRFSKPFPIYRQANQTPAQSAGSIEQYIHPIAAPGSGQILLSNFYNAAESNRKQKRAAENQPSAYFLLQMQRTVKKYDARQSEKHQEMN
jgi:hypothetical protein